MNNSLDKYIKETSFPNQKITISKNNIIINTIPFNNNLFFSYLYLGVPLLLLYKTKEEQKFLAWILLVLFIVNIWNNLKSINRITIDKEKNLIKVKSKNPVKYIFSAEKNINFLDIQFCNHLKKSSPYNFTRYQIVLHLKNEKSVLLTDFAEENHAKTIANYINTILKQT